MRRSPKRVCQAISAAAVLMAYPQAFAQKPDADTITEHDKQVFKDFKGALGKMGDARKQKLRQTAAIMNLRQIGLAMFEFETEYGTFPDEKTAEAVKLATDTKAVVKADTANDCFFQLIASGIVQVDYLFSLDKPEKKPDPDAPPLDHLEECAFSYLIGMNASGNPGRPLVVAPLLNGKSFFDPDVLGGKAVVLRADCSVQLIPIEKDGRVLIDGRDIFDPAQPFWDGKVPPLRWPKE